MKSFKSKSTVINYIQWKKYTSFAKLLNRKIKWQIIGVVAEKLCLHRYIILVKIPDSSLKALCF